MRSESWGSRSSLPGFRIETWGTQIVGMRSSGAFVTPWDLLLSHP
jgi:hypothetical protein